MNENLSHTAYHPRWLRRKVSTYWWLERRPYFTFILRELSSVFVAWSVIYLLLLIRAVSGGNPSYLQFIERSANPFVLLVNILALLFIVLHSVTWFNLAPQAMTVRVGGRRLPGSWITGANYLLWALASALVVWILLGD